MTLRFRLNLALVLCLALAACSKSESDHSTSAGGPTIGVTIQNREAQFYQSMELGMKTAASKYGYEVEVVDANRDNAKQQSQVEDFISKKVAAIVITPYDSQAIGSAIVEANQAKIPVFTADIANTSKHGVVVSHIASNNIQGGAQAAKLLCSAITGKTGEIAIIDEPEVTSVQDRVRGFKAELTKDCPDVSIVADINGGGERAKSSAATEDIFQSHPHLVGIFGINDDSALGASKAVQAAQLSGKIAVVGYDATQEAQKAIAQGLMTGDAIQNPEEIGTKTIDAVHDFLNGKEPPAHIAIPVGSFTKADVTQAVTRKIAMTAPATSPLLEMANIVKLFPGVRALDGVSFTLERGEVHALVGENGAGKSTLMKVLAGAQRADGGTICIDGTEVVIANPKAAERYGIGMIAQEMNLVPTLGVIENIILGIEPSRGVFVDRQAGRDLALNTLRELGVTLPLTRPAARLSVAQQQLVEIAKALTRRARILVMDEPTAALSDREIDHLFTLITHLKSEGVACIYISHRMEELPRIADRATVLRDGRTITTRRIAEYPRDEMIAAMVGRTVETQFPDPPPLANDAPIVLGVHQLNNDSIHDISFEVRAGEILGIAGLVGAGRTEILRAIAGADPTSGTVTIDGKAISLGRPRNAIDAGIAFITEDRKGQGLVLGMNVRENTTLAHLGAFSRGFFIDRHAEVDITARYIHELRTKTPGTEQRVGALSGGNQQKVVLAKWLAGKARVILFDEPTRGIDVGAKMEIYELLVQLAKAGVAMVIVSSELPEVLGLSHRALVIRGGRVVAEYPRAELRAESVIAAATGAA